MAELNCIDMSRWGGELTAEEAGCLKASGIRLLIVGTGNPHPGGAGEWARQQAQAWIDAGGEALDAYIYLYFAGDPRQQVLDALGTLAGLPVRRWWLDAEDVDSESLSPAQRATFLMAAMAAIERATLADVGIYSASWWWPSHMGDTRAFADLPLWNSYYDGDPDTDGLPYGGWAESAIEQYQGTTVLCGQSVDLNYAKDLEEPLMSKEFEEALLLRLFAGTERHDDPSPDYPEGRPHTREERLSYARGILAQDAQSVIDVAASGLAVALLAKQAAEAPNAGSNPPGLGTIYADIGQILSQAGKAATQAGMARQGGK